MRSIGRSLRILKSRWVAGFIAVTALTSLLGCTNLSVVKFGDSKKEKQARELQSLLERYTREFAQTVEHAADEIVDTAPDFETKRATVRWKLQTIPRVKELSRSQANQGETLLALWLYTEIQLRYYEQGEGREVFGGLQPIATAACRELAAEIAAIARGVLGSKEDFARAQQVIEDYARRHTPGRREDDYGSVESGIQELTEQADAFEWLPSFSLEAFNPFRGLDRSAAAIRHFTEKTNALIDEVYTELPWRIELLLYDIENRDTVRATRADLERFADSAGSLAQTADRLPADVKDVVKSALDEIDARQAGLRKTLRQTEDVLGRAEGLVSGLSQTAASLTDAGQAWDATFRTLGLGDEDEASASVESDPVAAAEKAGRPFDILDYRDTAQELRSVAVELRGLIQDVQALTETTGDGAPLSNIELAAKAAVAAATDQGRELVDHAALRLFQLVGAILLATILYRVVVWRIGSHTS